MTERDPYQIEREIEAERSALQRSLDELHHQFSPEALVAQATDYFKTHGKDVAQNLGRTAKDNPVALALTGIGVAWLMAGSRNGANRGVDRVSFDHQPQSIDDPRARAGHDPSARPAYDTGSAPKAQGFASNPTLDGNFDARVRAADENMRHEAAPATAAENGGKTMSEHVEGKWAAAKYRARDARNRVYRSAAELRERIEEGTADLPAAARARIRNARESAIAAQEQVERKAAELARRARQTSHDNPLMVGAIAFAVGAAFGASLPRTSLENRAVGAQRDRLFDEADRIFREETAKAKRVAETMVAEGQAVVKDTLSGSSGESEGKSGVARISEAGKTEAKRQRLGDVN